MGTRITILILVLATLGVGTAFADHLSGDPIPASLLVARNGHEWIYAHPCPPVYNGVCGFAGNGVVLRDGFVIPSAAEIGADFTDNADILAAFTAAGCGSEYFAGGYDHCDFSDMAEARVFNSPYQIPGNFNEFSETILVRGVPEPSTLALLGTGIAALWFRRRSAK